MREYEFILKDLDCANCANKIQIALSKNENLKDVIVNFSTLKLKYKTDVLTKEEVEKLVQEIEPEIELVEEKEVKQENTIRKANS